MPLNPNLRKFVRDLAVAALGFAAAYVAAHAADIGLDPAYIAAVTPVALLIYRAIRGQVGLGPDAPA